MISEPIKLKSAFTIPVLINKIATFLKCKCSYICPVLVFQNSKASLRCVSGLSSLLSYFVVQWEPEILRLVLFKSFLKVTQKEILCHTFQRTLCLRSHSFRFVSDFYKDLQSVGSSPALTVELDEWWWISSKNFGGSP